MQTPDELPVRAWQAVIDSRDTPRRVCDSQDKPSPSMAGALVCALSQSLVGAAGTPLVDTGDI